MRLYHRLTRHQWIIDNEYIQDWGTSCDLKKPLRFAHEGILPVTDPRLSPVDNLEPARPAANQSAPFKEDENNNTAARGANHPKITESPPDLSEPPYKLPKMMLSPETDLDKILQS